MSRRQRELVSVLDRLRTVLENGDEIELFKSLDAMVKSQPRVAVGPERVECHTATGHALSGVEVIVESAGKYPRSIIAFAFDEGDFKSSATESEVTIETNGLDERWQMALHFLRAGLALLAPVSDGLTNGVA